MSKNFDETVCLQSEKKDECERYEERYYNRLLRAQLALPAWPAYSHVIPQEKRVSRDPL